MDVSHWLSIGAVLAVLFVVLARWERRIERRHTERTVSEIREAKARGTDRAIAQHPQIEPLACIGCASCIAACPEEDVLGLVDGIAHVIHASRCVGHARCQDACPVGAIVVGLGDVSRRPDLPVLSPSLETTVPGIFVAGELGGIALIRNAVEQGARAVEEIARRARSERASRDADADLLVVGAGPAGLSASLKAIECGLRAITIDQDDAGGTIRKYPRRKLTLTQPVTIPLYGKLTGGEWVKEDLLALWERIVREFEIPMRRPVKLLGIEGAAGAFVASTTAGPIRTRYVLLALGRRGTPRRLGVPGEDAEKVLYQLVDAASYVGQKLLVVGGGDSAIEAATALANQRGNLVTLSYRKPEFFRLKPRNEERIREYAATGRVNALLSSDVAEIHPHGVVIDVGGDDAAKQTIVVPNDFVFVMAGGEPPFPLLKKIGIGFGADGSPENGAERARESAARIAS